MEAQCHAIQPRRLKDFLLDQNLPFPHYTRKSPLSIFIKAVKSSSILRRSISRRFSKKNSSLSSCLPEPTMARSTSVTVKDILRWRSFRDLGDMEVNNVAPHFKVESPSRCSTTTSDETPRSSWCDSDFTVGDSPIWCRGSSGDIEVTRKKDFHINVSGGARPHQTTRDPKDRIMHEEEEQFSPISVLDFTQHEETFSSFHQSLANMERRNIMLKQQIQDFENLIEVEDRCLVNKNVELDDIVSFEIEEKAIQLMDHVKTTSSNKELDVTMDDVMLLDFFRDELSTTKEVKGDGKFESRVLRMARSWVKGEDDGSLEWELEGTRDVCIGEMWKSGNWKDFEDEKQEIAIEIEKMMLNHLLDELSIDLLNI